MRPAYWIPVLALIGGIAGYALSRYTGWLGTTTGLVIGILAGTVLYASQSRKRK